MEHALPGTARRIRKQKHGKLAPNIQRTSRTMANTTTMQRHNHLTATNGTCKARNFSQVFYALNFFRKERGSWLCCYFFSPGMLLSVIFRSSDIPGMFCVASVVKVIFIGHAVSLSTYIVIRLPGVDSYS
jgi:hypothetical protein